MKRSLFTALFFLALFATKSWAQSGAPEKISFQAVVRNASNALVTNQAVGMRVSILQGSASGSAVYSETQTPTSNANGLVTIEIGGGNVVSGSISGINWVNGPYFVRTEVDPTGGTNYTITGTSQLLSVPYALYAKTSGSSTPGPAGPIGPQGLQGVQGPAGQGVPTGGTANQVLAKVDGTDYNTAWVTPSAGGGSAYPNVELSVTNTTIQNIPDLAGGTSTTVLNFSGSNNENASLTGGNLWNGSVFTVGSTGAGWYQINSQVRGVSATGTLNSIGVLYYMDKNNIIGPGKTGAMYLSSIFASGNTAENVLRQASHLNTFIYLNAGDTLRFRAFSPSNVTAANTSADGSTFLNILRIK